MKSTGEVMGIASNFAMAFAKSQNAAKNSLPKSGKVFISLCDLDKEFASTIAKSLVDSGFTIYVLLEELKKLYLKLELLVRKF